MNHPEHAVNFAPTTADSLTRGPFNTPATRLSHLLRVAVLAVLSGCGGGCPGEKPEASDQPLMASPHVSVLDAPKSQDRFEQEGFANLAEDLAPYAVGMNAANKEYFERILALMRTNLTGVNFKRSNFDGNPTIRAVTSVSRNFHDTNPPTVTLNETWEAANGIDAALAVHEMGHAADLLDSKANLDEATWSKIYGAPGNAIEIRTELKAWEIQLVLLNQMSGGLLDTFYMEINTQAKDDKSADEILSKYVDMIASKLRGREDQKGMLKRWLQIYFNYKSTERFGLNGRWSYDFATQIAAEYHKEGIQIYELELDPKDRVSDPSRCIGPLPEGSYNYTRYRPYLDLGKGLIGPAQHAKSFNE